MKRKNPENGKIFKQGDVRKIDKKIFMNYDLQKKTEKGFYKEIWYPKESYENYKKNIVKNRVLHGHRYRKNNIERRKSIFKKNSFEKRINPETGKFFSIGEKRQDGKIFVGYHKRQIPNSKYLPETWLSEDSYLRLRLKYCLNRYKRKSKKLGLKFDLDLNYIYEIFPKNNECPILQIEMTWGESEERRNSPSLDRIDPNLGYTKKNVRWISNISNVHKSDRDFEMIEKIYFDMKNIINNTPKYLKLINTVHKKRK